MKLLLDTHVVIWLATDISRVSARVLDRVASGEPICVSVVSAWEYGIKQAKRPREFRRSFDQLIEGASVERLDLSYAVHRFAGALPPIHGDPFDRMLIGQALHHDLELATSDELIRRYDVPCFW